jgi:hypothetical protein
MSMTTLYDGVIELLSSAFEPVVLFFSNLKFCREASSISSTTSTHNTASFGEE